MTPLILLLVVIRFGRPQAKRFSLLLAKSTLEMHKLLELSIGGLNIVLMLILSGSNLLFNSINLVLIAGGDPG